MKREKAEKKIRKYLYDLHVTLWADFDLHRPDSFEKAVEWFLDQVVRAGLVSDKEPQGAVKIVPDSPIAKEVYKLRSELALPAPDIGINERRFDSGFVTYKNAAQCICVMGDKYGTLDEKCPIHGPHAFPWRKSR